MAKESINKKELISICNDLNSLNRYVSANFCSRVTQPTTEHMVVINERLGGIIKRLKETYGENDSF